jgi:hypothetical protein
MRCKLRSKQVILARNVCPLHAALLSQDAGTLNVSQVMALNISGLSITAPKLAAMSQTIKCSLISKERKYAPSAEKSTFLTADV